jgi:arylsulfatase A-like enzyme
MPQCRRPARRAVSRPVCADEKNPALSADRKLLGTSKRASHPARPVPAIAPHGPRCSADACRSAIGRPILREARAAYLGKISFLDDLLGRIIDALKARGTWPSTILVFTADHGLAVGEHGNIAKGQFWEEVARVPMVMRIPTLTDQGVKVDALAQLIDLYPTLLDVVEGEVSRHVQGRSLMPTIRNPNAAVRTFVCSQIHHNESLDYMVCENRYKWFVEGGEESLYDLESDEFEQANLINSSEHEATMRKLRERLREFLMTQQVNHSVGYKPLAERVKNADE